MHNTLKEKPALRRYREARGWSRAYCADEVDVDPFTWKRWELGWTRPSAHHLFAAARLFGVPAGELNDFPPPPSRRRKPRTEPSEAA